MCVRMHVHVHEGTLQPPLTPIHLTPQPPPTPIHPPPYPQEPQEAKNTKIR